LLGLGIPGLLILLLTQGPPSPSINDDRRTIPEPKEREVAAFSDYVTSAILKPAAQKLNVPGDVLDIFKNSKEAENVTEFDEVADSSWFTNRNFWNPLSTDRVREGPVRAGDAPDAGSWTVTHCKTDGIMPGFEIRDKKGDSYILKFDPPGHLEMSTAADVIASKFLYAAGYNVPKNFIVTFDEHLLVPKHGLVCSGSHAKKLSSGRGELSQYLEKLPRTANGQLRAVASKFIEERLKARFRIRACARTI